MPLKHAVLGSVIGLVLMLPLALIERADAAALQVRPGPGGIDVTFSGINAKGGVPPGSMHCVTGTAEQWAGGDFPDPDHVRVDMQRMIGGCVPIANGSATHPIDARNARNGILCLVPLVVDPRSSVGTWSYHPEGPTKQKTRNGNMVTVIRADGSPVQPNDAANCPE